MSSLLNFLLILFLWIPSNYVLVETIDLQSIQEDLDEFQKSCNEDTCDYYNEESVSFWSCHCGEHCTYLDTCCLDSPYVNISQPEKNHACRTVHQNQAFFMIDHCFSNDSIWASLCNDEDNADGDVQKIVPVTSLVTSITYKNYYCFRCHEESDGFMHWKLNIEGNYSLSKDDKDEPKDLARNISLIYDKAGNTLMASYDATNTVYYPIKSSVEPPPEILNITHVCDPDIVSDCMPEWPNDDMREKCHSYTALKSVIREDNTITTYKNIHCALCSDESLDDVFCKKIMRGSFDGRRPESGEGNVTRPGYTRFSFTFLLDIGRSDGELVGKVQICPEDHIWDPYAKTCRELLCALPGFKIRNGKCVLLYFDSFSFQLV